MNNAPINITSIADPSTRNSLNAVRDRIGFVPILFATLAQQPGVVESFVALDDAFSATSLSPIERQVVLLTASVENEGAYCVAGHTIFARSIGMPEQAVEAIRSGNKPDDPRLDALQAFVAKLVQNRGHVMPADVDRLVRSGFSREQILEIIMGVTLKTFSNYVDSAMKISLDTAFEHAAWQPIVSPPADAVSATKSR